MAIEFMRVLWQCVSGPKELEAARMEAYYHTILKRQLKQSNFFKIGVKCHITTTKKSN